MKRIIAIVFALCLCSCAGAGPENKYAASTVQNPSAAPALPPEVAFGDRLLVTIGKADYPAFSALMRDSPSAHCTKEEFAALCSGLTRQFGKMKSFRYDADLVTPVVSNRIWIVTFERVNQKGKTVRQDLLFRLVSGREKDTLRILGFGFF